MCCCGTGNGLEVIDAGLLPTPALALEAMCLRLPAIVVTGSHFSRGSERSHEMAPNTAVPG